MSSYPPFPDLSRAPALRQKETTIDPTLRDPMDNGMESTRARFTRRRRTFTVSIELLTADDRDTLEQFVQDVVYGSLPFIVTDPRNAENPQERTVRFSALPTYSDADWIGADTKGNAAQYRWNCQFEVREV